MLTRGALAVVVVAGAVLGGCSGSGTASSGASPPPRPPLAVSAAWSGRVHSWERTLHAAAGLAPSTHFPTPGESVLRRRLDRASAEYGFRVVSLRFVRAPQGAPVVIVQATSSEASLAHDVPAIMRAIDPHRRAAEDWLGWAYEGFFLGAQSRRGSPFLDVSNVWRAHSGGQWAVRDSLYPYPHG